MLQILCGLQKRKSCKVSIVDIDQGSSNVSIANILILQLNKEAAMIGTVYS